MTCSGLPCLSPEVSWNKAPGHYGPAQAAIARGWTHDASAKSCPQRAVQNQKMFSGSNMWMFFSNRGKNMASGLKDLILKRQADGRTWARVLKSDPPVSQDAGEVYM